jgi:hypothetical protein
MKPKVKNEASILLWEQIRELRGRVRWAKEFKFHPDRRWKFDFCVWNEYEPDGFAKSSWAIEIDGGGWIGGRHNSGIGKQKDDEKFNHAALLGYKVLRFSPKQVLDGTAIAFIKKVLEA